MRQMHRIRYEKYLRILLTASNCILKLAQYVAVITRGALITIIIFSVRDPLYLFIFCYHSACPLFVTTYMYISLECSKLLMRLFQIIREFTANQIIHMYQADRQHVDRHRIVL